MPLYELFCLAKPALPRATSVRMLQRVGELVMDKGGVLTDVKSYGEQHLAYDIRQPFQRFEKAHIWEMTFMLGPDAIRDIHHELRVNKDVLRWMVRKTSEDKMLAAAASSQK